MCALRREIRAGSIQSPAPAPRAGISSGRACKLSARLVDGGEHAESGGRPKIASTNTGLSDVGISYDQSSRWQKRAAVSEEIFER